MNYASKKAFTLVEMIVSLAIVAIISVMLLGIITSTANVQVTAQERNEASYLAAEELEKKFYSMTEEHSDLFDDDYISTQDYVLKFNFEGQDMECEGTLAESMKPNTDVKLRGFWPTGEQAE